jgi:CDP-diacylglycerol--serine O-phosphatidyltransferase
VHSITEFGKQLDSLADVVSFGVAPSMILYRLILLSYVGSSPDSDFDVMKPLPGQNLGCTARSLSLPFGLKAG